MPVIRRALYQSLEYGLGLQGGGMVVGSVAGSVGPFTDTLPTFTGVVKNAFLDFIPGHVSNSFAGVNSLANDQYIQWKPSGGAYHNAILLSADSFYLGSSGAWEQGRIYGNTDIAPYVKSGDTIQWQWTNAKAQHDFLYFGGCYQPVLRVYIY